MEKFIINDCFNSNINKDAINKVKASLKDMTTTYLPKKDERIISTSVGYNK